MKKLLGSYSHIICGIWILDPAASNVFLMVKLLYSPSGGPYDLLGNLRVFLDYTSETFPFFFFFFSLLIPSPMTFLSQTSSSLFMISHSIFWTQ